jgi:hypothetical protein
MSFLLGLLLSAAAWAQTSWIEAPVNHIPVFAKPSNEARVLYYTNEGEQIGILGRSGAYTKVKVNRNGKWRAGFIYTRDLAPGGRREAPVKGFGFGGGAQVTYLQQWAKSFVTEDQVNYTTSEFTSMSFSPALGMQSARKNFWRLLVAYRRTDFTGTARTDVSGSAARDVSIQHAMISGAFQKAWSSKSGVLYYGLGVEISKAMTATVSIGGVDIPTTDEDLPTYFGAMAFGGLQFSFGRKFTLFIEARPLVYVNQDPMVMGLEGAAQLLFWP